VTDAASFAAVPMNRALGWRLISSSPEAAEVRGPIQPSFAQEGGVVHGGIISAIADTAAVYAIHPQLPPGTPMTSIEFKVNFLRSGRMSGGELVARSQLVRRGRQVAVCNVDVIQDDVVIATGVFTYLIGAKEWQRS
jgi:uncharacterized protein (TIGR00369 family)